jgi:predicted esterase
LWRIFAVAVKISASQHFGALSRPANEMKAMPMESLTISFRKFGILIATLIFSAVLAHAANVTDWREKMKTILPKSYQCRHAAQPVTVDGKLDEAVWNDAPWTDDFGDIQGGSRPKPRFRTRAKMLWDDQFLYVAAELDEPNVWATLTNHDGVIFFDPDFEVFIDPKGETAPYGEFEMNALNTTWDLLLNKPYIDQGKPQNDWEITGLKSAVEIRGTLNNPADRDRGWTIEIAFPWESLSKLARHAGAPHEGEQWRMNFSRVEWQTVITNGVTQKIPNTPEDNWVWSPQGVIDMHRPEMWGLVRFIGKSNGEKFSAPEIPGKSARDRVLDVYYAQLDFFSEHKRWASNFVNLKLNDQNLTSAETAPILEMTADGYVCGAAFMEGGKSRVWRIRQDRLLKLDEPMPLESETFVREAAEKFGDAGRRAAYFLVDNMPVNDRSALDHAFLMENLSLAFKAREKFSWAKNVPETIFFNDVLPYASLDEPRDPWRADFLKLASEIVSQCTNATDAAQALNREIFNRLRVHYDLRRKRNNQSPKESIEQGMATCTGLSIILVDACRAVGIPARLAGVPEWVHKEGNHTWVEIWTGEWHFTGADEYEKEGFDRAWFNGDAARTSKSSNPTNQVYASSWRRTGDYFPLAWDFDSRTVPAVNVSSRYAALEISTNTTGAVVHIRLREKPNGARLVADVEMSSAGESSPVRGRTRAGTADLNDMPEFKLPDEARSVTFRFRRGAEAREKVLPCAVCVKSPTLDFVWDELTPVPRAILAVESWLAQPLENRPSPPTPVFSKYEASRLISLAWNDLLKIRTESAEAELSAKKIVLGDNSLKWMEKTFGSAPDGKHSLWITLHGGGQGTEEENDRNWKGYFGRYEFPPGAINVAPRAPANTWDMWHVKWTDDLLDRLVGDYVLRRGLDPERVYLIGYSAGGDGVYQLAPRMSDRFAGAAMCAGHPNEVTPEGLRNLPFFLYMGGDDSAYNRNVVVREFSARMDTLQSADPAGYTHRLTVFPGLPHNMQNREAEMIPLMTPLRRVSWPTRVVWKQDADAPHSRLYWLERVPDATRLNDVYSANVSGQTVTIGSPAKGSATLRLSDALVDLDKPVQIIAGGKTVFDGKVLRSFEAILHSLRDREDPSVAATALLRISW